MAIDDQQRPVRRSHEELRVTTVHDGVASQRSDLVVVEEPLQVRLRSGDDVTTVAVTMRTPGSDLDLARGFLWTEGVVTSPHDVLDVAWCRDEAGPVGNVVTVTVRGPLPDLDHLRRHGSITSACGVCGRTAIDDLQARTPAPEGCDLALGPAVTAELLLDLPRRLAAAQELFTRTGGLHAAARFAAGDGRLLDLREDVGRHNALDKLIGAAVRVGDVDWHDDMVLLSGRASWELLQKAVTVRARIVAAVGAPSSLAVAVAEQFGVTLVGFLREDRFNVYTHRHRVVGLGAPDLEVVHDRS